MQSCQNWAQAWIEFDEGSWCTTISPHHQDGYAITFDSSACILHALHADLSRLWVLLEIQKSKWYVASRPLPYAGFFMKRRKYLNIGLGLALPFAKFDSSAISSSVCIFHGNLNHVKSWFKIAKSRDHVKFRDIDPLPHGSINKVWMVKNPSKLEG